VSASCRRCRLSDFPATRGQNTERKTGSTRGVRVAGSVRRHSPIRLCRPGSGSSRNLARRDTFRDKRQSLVDMFGLCGPAKTGNNAVDLFERLPRLRQGFPEPKISMKTEQVRCKTGNSGRQPENFKHLKTRHLVDSTAGREGGEEV